jgi:hypothetical protein
MPRNDIHEEEPVDEDLKDLIAGNVQRIKDLIYGTVDGSPGSLGAGHGTSGRARKG